MARPADAADVFICYAHKDSQEIEHDLTWLSSQGMALWYDPAIPGGEVWRDEIAHGIDDARVVVCFLSNQSAASPHCQREIHFATERNKPIIPVYLENVRLSAGLELTLGRHQAIFRFRLRRPEYQTMLLASLMPHISRAVPVDVEHAPVPRQKHAVAVVCFSNLSDDPEQTYFSEGLADDLLNGLSQSRDLIVKARSSSFQLRDQDVTSIGRLLTVSHVVQGSVRKSGSRIRVNVQLVETTDETVVWSSRYDRQLADVFTVQDEITSAILEALGTELGSPAHQSTDVPIDAYNAYLRGRYHQERMELPMAVDAFEQAISIEPRYADAHAALAGALRAIGGPILEGEPLRLVQDHLNIAIAADPDHPVALSHRAGIRFFVDREYQTAIYEFDRLVRQFPSTPFGGYHAALHTIGRFDLALNLTRRTLKLNPLSPQTHQDRGMHLRELGRLDEASRSFDEAERLGIALPHEHAEIEFRRRNQEGLSTNLQRIGHVFGETSIRFLITQAGLLYLQKLHRDARTLLKSVERSPEHADRNWFKALFALRANESDLAIEYYARALQAGELQAFVFSQPCPELEQLFPDFFHSAARRRMLQTFGLDQDSLAQLDVPPLPAWAVED